MKNNIFFILFIFFIFFSLSCNPTKEEKYQQKALLLANKLDIRNATYFDEPKDSLCKKKYLENEWCITEYVETTDTVDIELYSINKNDLFCIELYEHICEIKFVKDKLISINYAIPNFKSVNFQGYTKSNIKLLSKQKRELFIENKFKLIDCKSISYE